MIKTSDKRCSYCKETGHHRGKCSTFNEDIIYIEKFRQLYMKSERDEILKHLPIGSLIAKENVYGKNILCVPVGYVNTNEGDRTRMDIYTIESASFVKYDKYHATIVHRLYADRNWRKEEEKLPSAGVYLMSVSGEKLQHYSIDGNKEFITFGQLKYDVRRNRFKIISE